MRMPQQDAMMIAYKFLLGLESAIQVGPNGDVIIPFDKAHDFYSDLRMCQRLMSVQPEVAPRRCGCDECQCGKKEETEQ